MTTPAHVESALAVGDRVTLKRDVDRLPDFYVLAGATGTITGIEVLKGGRQLTVKLDVLIDGAEEWDNEVVWSDGDDSYGYLAADLGAQEPAPTAKKCTHRNSIAVDIDGAGEDFRFCNGCGANFWERA